MKPPLKIVRAMASLQKWCYSVRCCDCPNVSKCRLGDDLYSRTDYYLISDKDIAKAEKRVPKITQLDLFGGF